MRIFFLILIVGIIPLFLIKVGILSCYENISVKMRTNLIQDQCKVIASQIGDGTYLTVHQDEKVDIALNQLANLYSGRILIVDSSFVIVRDTFGLDEGKTIVTEPVIRSFQGINETTYNQKEHYFDFTIALLDGISKEQIGVMLVTVPVLDIRANQKEMDHRIIWLQAILVLCILLFAFYCSKALIRPIERITHSLEEMKTGFLEEVLSVSDYTETKMLSEAFNRMVQRMKELDDSRSEFVSNVSHELKTPLTSMKVLADSLTMQEDVPPELYREFMADIGQEIERENQIITDLLSLVRLDKKADVMNIQEVNVNDLIALVIKRLRPIAQKNNVELICESYRPVVAQIDETKLSLVITNLVENAIKYNKPEGGWVHVSLNADVKFFLIRVEDSGIGIPEKDKDNVFERFFRVDKSHSREIGGTGLGLAITKSAVKAHNGVIRVYSKEGEGTTFQVRIPLQYTSQDEES